MAATGILWMALSAAPVACPGQEDVREYDVKAAYLFNFAVHVEWPAGAFKDARSPILLRVLGKDPFEGRLVDAFKGKLAQDRRVEVEGVKSVEELKPCHILFIPDSEKQHLPRALEILKGESVLIVGETEGLARRGAILNFVMENNRVRLEANTEAAVRSRLKIGAKLLKVARIVGDSGR